MGVSLTLLESLPFIKPKSKIVGLREPTLKNFLVHRDFLASFIVRLGYFRLIKGSDQRKGRVVVKSFSEMILIFSNSYFVIGSFEKGGRTSTLSLNHKLKPTVRSEN